MMTARGARPQPRAARPSASARPASVRRARAASDILMQEDHHPPEDDDLCALAASAPAHCPRGTLDDELVVAHIDARHFRDNIEQAARTLSEYAARRQPVVLSGCVEHWPALRKWTHGYLRTVLGDRKVHVARTPNGLGDAVTMAADGSQCFVKPHEVQMAFGEFVDAVESPLRDLDGARRAVHYASHQNGCLATEYEPLWADVDLALPWADASFGQPPAATNFWMGEDAARTTVHADLFDNIYVVVRGTKHFTLLPPQEGHLLQRRAYPAATYVPSEAAPDRTGLLLTRDQPAASVLWSPVDMDAADSAAALRPVRAEVAAGETLYLPALWWHAVSQSGAKVKGAAATECTMAVNYWYDSGALG